MGSLVGWQAELGCVGQLEVAHACTLHVLLWPLLLGTIGEGRTHSIPGPPTQAGKGMVLPEADPTLNSSTAKTAASPPGGW